MPQLTYQATMSYLGPTLAAPVNSYLNLPGSNILLCIAGVRAARYCLFGPTIIYKDYDRSPKPAKGSTKATLPTTTNNNDDNDGICIFCQEVPVFLPTQLKVCGHLFCNNCIAEWGARGNRHCPCCLADLIVDGAVQAQCETGVAVAALNCVLAANVLFTHPCLQKDKERSSTGVAW
jgi:hypothetical protein